MNISSIEISRLRDYENNPRNNDAAVEKVAASIKRFGFLFPVIIDANNIIVCGHTRKKACRSLGIREIPCIRIEHLTPEQVDYFRLADNRTSEYAGWDLNRLDMELKSIDLASERNELIVRAYELEMERASLETEFSEIKVERFNFLDSRQKSAGQIPHDTTGIDKTKETQDAHESDVADKLIFENDIDCLETHTGQVAGKAAPANNMLKFECGGIRFAISRAELDMLNAAYLFYIDNVYPGKTFIDFVLERKSD